MSKDLRIVENKHGVILTGEPSVQVAALVYLRMDDASESLGDGREMYLTREQAAQLRDWLNDRLTG